MAVHTRGHRPCPVHTPAGPKRRHRLVLFTYAHGYSHARPSALSYSHMSQSVWGRACVCLEGAT
eukprot:scaffold26587_cov107-Isochrysis_galbana.AAC.2